MFRPLLVIAAGVLLASGSMISLLLVLPRGTPVTLLSCTVKDQVRECAGHTNPVYLIAFIGFIVGICLPFYGVFGRSFILNPFFMIGILVVALGSFGVIFGYLNAELCASYQFPSFCLRYNPEPFYLVTLAGFLLITGAAYQSRGRIPRNPTAGVNGGIPPPIGQ